MATTTLHATTATPTPSATPNTNGSSIMLATAASNPTTTAAINGGGSGGGGVGGAKNPQLKRIVYSKYRELLGSYNDKANAIIDTLPAYMVHEDRGFHFEPPVTANNNSNNNNCNGNSNGYSNGNSYANGNCNGSSIGNINISTATLQRPTKAGAAPATTLNGTASCSAQAAAAASLWQQVAAVQAAHAQAQAQAQGVTNGGQLDEYGGQREAPACVQNAMMTKDKKPFTYTPGGIDLSQIKSERMAKRLARNAQSDTAATGAAQNNRPGQPQSPASSGTGSGASTPNPTASMGAAALGMPFQVLPPPPPPPSSASAGKKTIGNCAAAPPPPPPATLAPPPPPPLQLLSPNNGNGSKPNSPNMPRKSPTPQRFEPPPLGFRPEIKIPTNPMAALRKVAPPVEKNTFWKDEYVKERSKTPMDGDTERNSASPAVAPSQNNYNSNNYSNTNNYNYNNNNNNNGNNSNFNNDSDVDGFKRSTIAPPLQQQQQQPQQQYQYSAPPTPSQAPQQQQQQQQQQTLGGRPEFRSVHAPQSPSVNVYTRQVDSPVVSVGVTAATPTSGERANDSPFKYAPQQQQQQLQQSQQQRTPPAISPLAQQQQQQQQQQPQTTNAQAVPWRTQRTQQPPTSSTPTPLQQQQQQPHSQAIYNNATPQQQQAQSQQQRSRDMFSPATETAAPYQGPKPTNVGSLYIAPLAPINNEPQAQNIVRQQQQQMQQQQQQLQQQQQQARQPARWMSTQPASKEQPEWARPEENGNVMPSTLNRLKSPPPPSQMVAAQQQQQHQAQNFGAHPTGMPVGMRLQINTNTNPNTNTNINNNTGGPKERIIPIQLEQTPTYTPSAQPNFNQNIYNVAGVTITAPTGYVIRTPNQFVDQGYNNYPNNNPNNMQQQQRREQNVMSPTQQLNAPRMIQQQQQQLDGNKTHVIPIAIEGGGGPVSQTPVMLPNDPRATPTQSKSFRILQKITDTVGQNGTEMDSNKTETNQVDLEPQLQRPSYARQMSAQQARNSPTVEQMRRMQISQQEQQKDQYIPPSEQQVTEPKKYTGSAIPSRSFKILQAMTTPENAAEMEDSESVETVTELNDMPTQQLQAQNLNQNQTIIKNDEKSYDFYNHENDEYNNNDCNDDITSSSTATPPSTTPSSSVSSINSDTFPSHSSMAPQTNAFAPYPYPYPYPWYPPPPVNCNGESTASANWPPFAYGMPPPQAIGDGTNYPPPFPYYYPFYPPPQFANAQIPSMSEYDSQNAYPLPPPFMPQTMPGGGAYPYPYPYPYGIAPSFSGSSTKSKPNRASSVLPDIIITPSSDDNSTQNHLRIDKHDLPPRARSVDISDMPSSRLKREEREGSVIDALTKRLENISKGVIEDAAEDKVIEVKNSLKEQIACIKPGTKVDTIEESEAETDTEAETLEIIEEIYETEPETETETVEIIEEIYETETEPETEIIIEEIIEEITITEDDEEEDDDDSTEEDSDPTPKGSDVQAVGLQSIKSVTNVRVYNEKTAEKYQADSDNDDDDETSADGESDVFDEEEEEEEVEIEIEENDVHETVEEEEFDEYIEDANDLSIIYEEESDFEKSSAEQAKTVITKPDISSSVSEATTLDNDEVDNEEAKIKTDELEEEDGEDSTSVTVRLPLKFSFTRSANDQNITTVEVGNSEIEEKTEKRNSFSIAKVENDSEDELEDDDCEVSVTISLSGSSRSSSCERRPEYHVSASYPVEEIPILEESQLQGSMEDVSVTLSLNVRNKFLDQTINGDLTNNISEKYNNIIKDNILTEEVKSEQKEFDFFETLRATKMQALKMMEMMGNKSKPAESEQQVELNNKELPEVKVDEDLDEIEDIWASRKDEEIPEPPIIQKKYNNTLQSATSSFWSTVANMESSKATENCIETTSTNDSEEVDFWAEIEKSKSETKQDNIEQSTDFWAEIKTTELQTQQDNADQPTESTDSENVTNTPLIREEIREVKYLINTLQKCVELMPQPQLAEIDNIADELVADGGFEEEEEQIDEDFWSSIEKAKIAKCENVRIKNESNADHESEEVDFWKQIEKSKDTQSFAENEMVEENNVADYWSQFNEEPNQQEIPYLPQTEEEDVDFWADAQDFEEKQNIYDPTQYPEEPREVDTDEEIDFWAEIEAKQNKANEKVNFRKASTFWASQERQNSVEETPYMPVRTKAFPAKLPDEPPSVDVNIWAALEAARGEEPVIIDPSAPQEEIVEDVLQEEEDVNIDDLVSETASVHEPVISNIWEPTPVMLDVFDSETREEDVDIWANMASERMQQGMLENDQVNNAEEVQAVQINEESDELEIKRNNYRKAMAFFTTSIDEHQKEKSVERTKRDGSKYSNRNSAIEEEADQWDWQPTEVALTHPQEHQTNNSVERTNHEEGTHQWDCQTLEAAPVQSQEHQNDLSVEHDGSQYSNRNSLIEENQWNWQTIEIVPTPTLQVETQTVQPQIGNTVPPDAALPSSADYQENQLSPTKNGYPESHIITSALPPTIESYNYVNVLPANPPEVYIEPEKMSMKKLLPNGLPDLGVNKPPTDELKISVRDRISAFETGSVEPPECKKIDIRAMQSLSVESTHHNGSLTRNNSSQRSESEMEEDDSGVTDMNKPLSETDTESESFPELRKMTSYQRAATHSRLFRLLQDENDILEEDGKLPGSINDQQSDEFKLKPSRRKIIHNVSITRRQNPNALADAETMTQRRERLSLPLRKNISIDADNPSTPNSPASPIMGQSASAHRPVSDKLVNELVQSLLLKRDSTHLRHLPMEKLQAAAKRVLEEELDSLDNTSVETTPAPTPNDVKNDKSYAEYYESWSDATGSAEVVPSKTFKNLQETIGSRRGPWSVRCPRVLSSKTINRDLARVTESPEILSRSSRSPDFITQSRESSVSKWRKA